jgi:poly(A) polymerase
VEHKIPRADLDPDAVKIVQRLTRYRHKAYLVGGCVRDLLLGLQPKDFDIATSATPRQVKRLFRNSRVIGRRFRLAHVYFHGGKIIEVATFRSRDEDADEAEGGDVMIRDDNRFGTTSEDALRRDFTINQLFYDIDGSKVIDHAGGLADLEQRLVRTIGEPELRFREDPIRILRAIKFAARLDLEIESATLRALEKTRRDIPKAAAPRVLEEINRFCLGGRARRSFELLFTHHVFEVILPELRELYSGQDRCRELLFKLLEGLDRRTAQDITPDTGEILALLLLPGLTGPLGWTDDGRASQPRGLHTRDLVDETLRPLAIRLRVSKRDQETCRQIVMTLFRMVPHDRMRRNVKRSLLRRQCLPSAIWILERLGESFGGAFADAAAHWTKYRDHVAGDAAPQAPDEPKREDESRGRRRGSRGRRGRRGRKTSEQEPRDESKERPKPKPGEDGWDEDYFFTALPTVPQLGDEGEPNRYGKGQTASGDTGVEPEADAEAGTEGGAEPSKPPASGRRPRRRRRRRRAASPASDDSTDG